MAFIASKRCLKSDHKWWRLQQRWVKCVFKELCCHFVSVKCLFFCFFFRLTFTLHRIWNVGLTGRATRFSCKETIVTASERVVCFAQPPFDSFFGGVSRLRGAANCMSFIHIYYTALCLLTSSARRRWGNRTKPCSGVIPLTCKIWKSSRSPNSFSDLNNFS